MLLVQNIYIQNMVIYIYVVYAQTTVHRHVISSKVDIQFNLPMDQIQLKQRKGPLPEILQCDL